MGEIALTPFELIFKVIRTELKVQIQEMKSKDRRRDIVEARQMFCVLARRYTIETTTTIGAAVNRDHSTVLYSIHAMLGLCSSNVRLGRAKSRMEKSVLAQLRSSVKITICDHCKQPIHD